MLLSGGLDSTLAAKMMLEQGVELEAINFASVFSANGNKSGETDAQKVARQLGVSLTVKNITKELIGLVQSPKYGHGSGANPCIDCRIMTFKMAKEFMKEAGASFIVTGEVAGERPMSQTKGTIIKIEKEAGFEKLVVRPLSAKLFDPTLPEEEGVIDRNRLLGISGRSRKKQIEMAREFDIKDYPWPAGGCLLTDPGFSSRVKDLLAHSELTPDNATLLKLGRHFRLSEKAKLVVGRNEKENDEIFKLSKEKDLLIEPKDMPGPFALIRGEVTADELGVALGIAARYTDKSKDEDVLLEYWDAGKEHKTQVKSSPQENKALDRIRI